MQARQNETITDSLLVYTCVCCQCHVAVPSTRRCVLLTCAAPLRYKGLYLPLSHTGPKSGGTAHWKVNAEDWSDDEPDALTNSFLPSPDSVEIHAAGPSSHTESNFGDAANFMVNALHSDACSSCIMHQGRWSSISTSCSQKITNAEVEGEHTRK